MTWMLKNSIGRPDAMLTVAICSTAVVLIKVLVSGVVYGQFHAGVIDGGLVAATLTPTLGAYVARRWHGTKSEAPQK